MEKILKFTMFLKNYTNHSIVIHNLNSGVYFLKIAALTVKFIKEKKIIIF
jgi:hypothetical protein